MVKERIRRRGSIRREINGTPGKVIKRRTIGKTRTREKNKQEGYKNKKEKGNRKTKCIGIRRREIKL